MSEDEPKVLATLGTGPAAKALYDDLLKPAATEIGTNVLAVAKVVTHALTPLHAVVWGMDKLREWLIPALARRLEGIDRDHSNSTDQRGRANPDAAPLLR